MYLESVKKEEKKEKSNMAMNTISLIKYKWEEEIGSKEKK